MVIYINASRGNNDIRCMGTCTSQHFSLFVHVHVYREKTSLISLKEIISQTDLCF